MVAFGIISFVLSEGIFVVVLIIKIDFVCYFPALNFCVFRFIRPCPISQGEIASRFDIDISLV